MGKKIRVAVIGVGNCASSLVQGVYFYRNSYEENIPGIMHTTFGDYHIGDIEFTFAVDINREKIGKDISEAIFAPPNNTFKFSEVPNLSAPVIMGNIFDGIGKYLKDVVKIASNEPDDFEKMLRETNTDVVVNFLPVGSEKATKWYVEKILNVGTAFVNGIPVFIASDKTWARKFKDKGVPVIGDDIKSQVGATILHRMLARLFVERGVKILRTSQLNIGGNTDFLNMLERERLFSKKISKTRAVTSMIPYEISENDVYIGPSDYVPWLKDRKWAHIRMEGQTFGNVPLNFEAKLEVWDSPNSAGVMIDAIRAAKIALDRGLSGPIIEPSSYFMKSPPVQYPDNVAREKLEAFISGI